MISVIREDITRLPVDAIVNAANSSLRGGGGVDGAIHRAAGPELLQECKTIGGCPTGEARITKGYNLPSKFVIHTVGPIYGRDPGKQAQLLKNCYLNSLELALANGCRTVAFPNISTGVYGYPKLAAAEIAVAAVKEFCHSREDAPDVTFVCFDSENHSTYRKLLEMD